MCPATFSQIAAVSALNGPQEPVDAMVREFKQRRDVVVKGLNSIPGMSCITPQGAFYAFANIQKTGMGSRDLQRALLEAQVPKPDLVIFLQAETQTLVERIGRASCRERCRSRWSPYH